MSILGVRSAQRPIWPVRRLLATSMLALGMSMAGVTVPLPVQAQSSDARLDRIERDLQLLQRQVYRGDYAAGQAPTAAATSGASVAGDAATRLQSRITDLEQLVTRLTGQVEETQYQVQRMDQQLKRFMEDVTFRLQQLEGTGEPDVAPGVEQTVGENGAGQDGFRSATPSQPALTGGQGAGTSGLAPAEGTLGTIPADRPSTMPAPQPEQGAVLPEGSPEEQYKYAFGLLRENAYDRAAKAFQAFVTEHPEHELAGNAQYWLGETHYVRGDYERAAVVFLDGYRGYPKSPKAPDNLLKLGLAMSQLGKVREACAAFTRIGSEYPQAADPIQRRARSEAERLNCGNL